MKRQHPNLYVYLHALLITALALISAAPANAEKQHRKIPVGTWYLALDAEPHGLPPDTNLPGLVMLNRDGTALLADGGDFGGFPFPTRDSNQFGTWRRSNGGIRMVMLFLQADTISGDVVAWNKVHLELSWQDRSTLAGLVNVFRLDCTGMAPAGVFNCPDPIGNAGAFVQDPVENVEVTLRRLSGRFVLPD